MKKLFFCVIIILPFLLSSCTAQKEADINEFVSILNSENTQSIQAEKFRIKKDGERYRYSYVINKNTMLCLYSDKDCIINQCTVTSLSDSKEFSSLCAEVTRTFSGKSIDESKTLVKSAYDSPVIADGYKLTLIDSTVGLTFLINYESDEINTNEHPTLKKYIKEEDITRPTIGEEKSLSENN